MISNKFAYIECPRENINGSRHYCTPDGSKVPSVTTILDRTKPEEAKEALRQWKKRVGEQQAQQITTEAASRGTRMHSYLEYYVKDGFLKEAGSNPYTWASHAMAQQVINKGLIHVDEYWGLEVPLYFPSIYAGTTDCVGVHKNTPAILDFKQANKPKKREWIGDYFLQLAAYAEAHNEVHGTEINKGVILMCVRPEVDANQRPITEPEYQEFIVEGEEFKYWKQQWWQRVEQFYLTK